MEIESFSIWVTVIETGGNLPGKSAMDVRVFTNELLSFRWCYRIHRENFLILRNYLYLRWNEATIVFFYFDFGFC